MITNRRRKIAFYLLTLKKHTISEDGNTERITNLSSKECKKQFEYIFKKCSTTTSKGTAAFKVDTQNSSYVVELTNYTKDHKAFFKIGQQNPTNTVQLRDQKTLQSEKLKMKESQLLELYTYCMIDFNSGIISYIGINGAPKISAIRYLFNNNLSERKISAEISAIMTKDIVKTLKNKKTISKLTVNVAIPKDEVLAKVFGLEEKKFDLLENINEQAIELKLKAPRNKSLFNDKNGLEKWIEIVQETFGDNIKSMTANAKNPDESSQAYDLLQYSFTRTVDIGHEDANVLTENDFIEALKTAYDASKDDLLNYVKVESGE